MTTEVTVIEDSAIEVTVETTGPSIEVIVSEGVVGPAGEPGAQGIPGERGADGKTAYQSWLDQGNTGTESDFIASLKGAKGDTGAAGPAGADSTVPGPAGPSGADGPRGDKGDTGQGFKIAKVYASVAALLADNPPVGVASGEFGIVTSTVSDPDNAKLYLWSGSGWSYVTDMSGAQGIEGPAGPRGDTGLTGATGPAGPSGVVSATSPLAYNSGTQTVSIQQSSSSQSGFLSSTDFTTFANKQSSLGFTPVPNTRLVAGHALSSDVTITASDVGADPSGAAASVQTNLNTHTAATGTAVHGLGSAATHAATDFDAAGSAATVQANLGTHAAATGTSVHGLGSASTHAVTDFDAAGAATAAQAAAQAYADSTKLTKILPATLRTIYVAVAGNDTTGDGTIANPYATIAKALSIITSPYDQDHHWVIRLGPGRFIETSDIVLPPYVDLIGDSHRATYVRVNGGTSSVKPSSAWATSSSWTTLKSIYFGGSTVLNFDLQSIGGSNSNVVIQDVWANTTVTFKGRNAGGGDFLEAYDTLFLGNVTMDQMNVQWQGGLFAGSLTISASLGACSGSYVNCNFGGPVSVTGTFSNTQQFSGSPFSSTTATLSTTGTVALTVDSQSIPPKPLQTLSVGTTITYLNDSTTLKYTPTTSADWATVPSTAQAALDTVVKSFVGDTGSGGVKGLVPAPSSGNAAQGYYLAADGSWKYVDQSKSNQFPFTLWNMTAGPSGALKYEDVTIYTVGPKTYALVSAGGTVATLFLYDVTNQEAPVLKSQLILAGSYKAQVQYPYAYVPSSGGSRLYIVDLTNPSNMVSVGNVLISGSPGSLYNCVVSGNYCYISTQSQGLTVVDVTNPALPVQVYQEGGGVKSFGIAFGSAGVLYTTNYTTATPWNNRVLKTWNITTPTAPTLSNTYTLPLGALGTKLLGLTVAGNTAYLSEAQNMIVYVVDVTTPTSPSVLSTLTPSGIFNSGFSGQVAHPASYGPYVYLPSGSSATVGGFIDMFDLTDRSNPKKVATVSTGVANSVFGGISVYNGFIYAGDYGVAPGNSSLDVFTEPFESMVAGSITTSTMSGRNITLSEWLRLNAHTVLGTPVDGSLEYDGTNLYFTVGSSRVNLTATGSGVTQMQSVMNALVFG